MTAKEFLRECRRIDRRIDWRREQLDRLRAQLEHGRRPQLTGMPRGGHGGDWTATADKLIDLESRLDADLRRMCDMKQAAMDAIAAVGDPRLRDVLELYYLCGYSWEGVAEKLGYDLRWVYRLHGRALAQVRVPEGWEEKTGYLT